VRDGKDVLDADVAAEAEPTRVTVGPTGFEAAVGQAEAAAATGFSDAPSTPRPKALARADVTEGFRAGSAAGAAAAALPIPEDGMPVRLCILERADVLRGVS